jgi:hypothetical protein
MTKWFDKFVDWAWKEDKEIVYDVSIEPKKIDMMEDDVDPNDISIENAYKTRWIWYHTILAIGIFMTNILLISILLLLAIKL